jgi:hypothetical protein
LLQKLTASPAFQLCQHMWNHVESGRRGHAWLTVNHAMHQTLTLAVKSGMKFDRDDFEKIHGSFRGWFWFGVPHEHFHSEAIKNFNVSAWQFYETWVGRKSFIVDNRRMHVGMQFIWKSLNVTCTSFNDEKGYFVAVQHRGWVRRKTAGKSLRREEYDNTPKRLFRIYHADLRAENRSARLAKRPVHPADATVIDHSDSNAVA